MSMPAILTNLHYITAITALISLLVGRLLLAIIYRLPQMMHENWRKDCADYLQIDAIAPAVNLPVLSRASALRNHFVVALTVVTSSLVVWHFGCSLQAIFALVLTWALIVMSFIDIDHQLLPDNITLPFLWLGLLLSLFGLFSDTHASIIGAAAGYGSLWCVYYLFKRLTGKEGLGFGDFKLLALFGAWLGWHYLPLIILLSSMLGAIVGVSLILFTKRDLAQPIPFGPYLAIAGWLALLWGDEVNRAYLAMVGI